MAVLITLVAWGVFAVTTIVPNPNDKTSIYGAFQSASPFQWLPNYGGPDHYNLAPGSAIDYVFEIVYSPIGRGGCGGEGTSTAPNGTIVAYCFLPKPNSTLTSTIGDYLTFSVRNDPKCCQQNYFNWLSGPTGNLTESVSGGGFFEIDQAGNYSVHISNTIPVYSGGIPLGWVNGTLTFSDGYVLFTRPYFLAGVATIGVAIATAGISAFSNVLAQRRSQKPSKDRDSSHKNREKTLPPEMRD